MLTWLVVSAPTEHRSIHAALRLLVTCMCCTVVGSSTQSAMATPTCYMLAMLTQQQTPVDGHVACNVAVPRSNCRSLETLPKALMPDGLLLPCCDSLKYCFGSLEATFIKSDDVIMMLPGWEWAAFGMRPVADAAADR